ncbi:MAG: flagellar hook capping protein [Ignavibacteriaceae bacterium]|nr:flagellar hook capping protein [Ignavibacterium sp.]MCC6253446.1 flagellar hook capping protein [Ignavibacteriaceae bacterium]HMN22854.1 flagellar hook capping FlgD N-terminal domain-containing protein [Ignavibacteriaceae bacterium]HRN27000.1 flagellar hook capping FlgD N-terminal domain-containing protein [Ignavibacteriaceae bacterium]HRP91984.1 flagellar hook capping FlgD N-terminal domain-containing protein [Ignavibacteriaceae bacterium]
MVDGLSNIATGYASGGLTNGTSMGKEDFLKLMLAQLQNQDPLSPMEGTEFASQLAQFTSLEQLMNLNDSMDTSINANYYLSQSINNTLAATLIGKEVKLSGNTFQNNGQESTTLGYNLSTMASSVTVNIYNESGQLVKTIHDAPKNSGDNKLIWDFSDNDGNSVPQGRYTFKVEPKDAESNLMSYSTYVLGKIDGVKFTENGTMLVVNGAQYNLSDIMEIYNSNDEG